MRRKAALDGPALVPETRSSNNSESLWGGGAGEDVGDRAGEVVGVGVEGTDRPGDLVVRDGHDAETPADQTRQRPFEHLDDAGLAPPSAIDLIGSEMTRITGNRPESLGLAALGRDRGHGKAAL
mgnify:CR=1 FL=1